ncbi:MAG: exo-beta-N-acetylmuramidase NamZ family protein [Lacipirellulaceae bacterium]
MRLFSSLLAVLLLTSAALAAGPVTLGIDALARDGFKPLVGKRIGLITNHTGVNSAGVPTADVLFSAPGVQVVRLFGPEHGVRGELDQAIIDDGIDKPTGLPVTSLYGPRRKPTPEQLADLDALVFDVQDVGCRFYTYVSTMKLAMKAAAEAGIEFVVLDRPNPIGGLAVEGPMRDGTSVLPPDEWGDDESFVACHALPLRHGMTVGELARLFAAEGPGGKPLGVKLTVVACEGWRRDDLYDATGLVWIDPSPNMRRLTQAIVYAGIGLLETTNVSVGRGTDTPFEVLGAPWINAAELAAGLRELGLRGVRFTPRYFTPRSSTHAGERCGGVDVTVTDPAGLHAVDLGLAIAATLRRLYPDDWRVENYPRLLVSDRVQRALVEGASAAELSRLAREGLDDFRRRRAAVLLYAE